LTWEHERDSVTIMGPRVAPDEVNSVLVIETGN
ncbi:MAG: hypothetical protein AVDCRST_MAG93-5574, partial [uncultured Chloroflexia bacterium]